MGESLHDQLNDECRQRDAMTSACVFAVFMFLCLVVQLVILWIYKDLFLGSGPLNEGKCVDIACRVLEV